MARRPRIIDLAREAGVSVATVDRLLNGREAVRAETAERVRAAAERLEFSPARLIAPVHVPELRLGAVLHKQGQDFYQDFARELALAVAALQGVRGRLVVDHASSQAPGEVAGLMRGMVGRVDVLAATAVNHPEITTAVEDLRRAGLPVFALLSDFAQGVRASYVGLNNLKVGRVAGWMIAHAARPGKVAVFVGGHRWHGHELREAGLRAYLREHAPGLEVMEAVVNLETRQLTYEATLALLARQPEVRGIYVAGGGMEGAIAALREMRAPGEVVLVVNELTRDSELALTEGWVSLVVATPLAALCRELAGLMRRVAAEGPKDRTGQHFLRADLHVAESI